MRRFISFFYRFAGLAAALVFLLSAGPAAALTISPTKILVTMDPGASRVLALTVFNEEAQAVAVTFGVKTMQQDEAGHPVFVEEGSEAERWVLSPGAVELRPGGRQIVRFQLAVPPNAEPGERDLGLVAQVRPAAAPEGVGVAAQLVALLAVQVSGIVVENMTMQVDAAPSVVVGSGNAIIRAELANRGTVEIPLEGRLVVRNWRGREVYASDVVLGNRLIPDSVRRLQWNLALYSTGCAGGALWCQTPRWPGRYTVSLQATYGKTRQRIEQSAVVWYFPWWSVGAAGVVLVGGFGAARALASRRRRRMVERLLDKK